MEDDLSLDWDESAAPSDAMDDMSLDDEAFSDLDLFDGYADSHFICFPYETRRTGIYTAGTVRRPMRLTRAKEDGTGAALKAIQAIHGAEFGQAGGGVINEILLGLMHLGGGRSRIGILTGNAGDR